jgi:hypothetical protein
MPNENFWNKNVARVEYDHRARDARRRLEEMQHLLVQRDASAGFRYFGLLRILLGNVAGNGLRRRQRTGSSNNRRPCDIGMPSPALQGSYRFGLGSAGRNARNRWTTPCRCHRTRPALTLAQRWG